MDNSGEELDSADGDLGRRVWNGRYVAPVKTDLSVEAETDSLVDGQGLGPLTTDAASLGFEEARRPEMSSDLRGARPEFCSHVEQRVSPEAAATAEARIRWPVLRCHYTRSGLRRFLRRSTRGSARARVENTRNRGGGRAVKSSSPRVPGIPQRTAGHAKVLGEAGVTGIGHGLFRNWPGLPLPTVWSDVTSRQGDLPSDRDARVDVGLKQKNPRVTASAIQSPKESIGVFP